MGSNHMHSIMKDNKKIENEEMFLDSYEKREISEKRNKELTEKTLESPMLISASEPKRKNQYIVKIEGLDVQPFVFQKITRPIKYHNGWGEMEIKVIELIGEDVHGKLDTLLKKKKGFFGNGDWKLNITLEELDPNGITISEWKYKTTLSAIEYCDMEYDSSEILNFSLHLSVSDVKHNSY